MKKRKPELIKMTYREEGDKRIRRRTCLVNPFDHGGEYTFCGDAWTDTTIDKNDVEAVVRKPFEGSCGQITCRRCKAIIRYAKEIIDGT